MSSSWDRTEAGRRTDEERAHYMKRVAALKHMGLSHRAIAQRLGIGVGTVSLYARRTDPVSGAKYRIPKPRSTIKRLVLQCGDTVTRETATGTYRCPRHGGGQAVVAWTDTGRYRWAYMVENGLHREGVSP